MCPLPAACPACHRLPEIQEPGDGRTKKNGCGSGSEEAAGRPASQQAFLQLSTPARHRDTGRWGTKESGGLRLTATRHTPGPHPRMQLGRESSSRNPLPEAVGRWLGIPTPCPDAQHSYPGRFQAEPGDLRGRKGSLDRGTQRAGSFQTSGDGEC